MYHDRAMLRSEEFLQAASVPCSGKDGDWALRAEFCRLIDELQTLRAQDDPVYFLLKLDQLRLEARRSSLPALVVIAEKCARALPRAVAAGDLNHFERDYAFLMREAVDCGDITPQQTQALLASAAYRITG